ncbi:MAG: glycosyltransferase, partial [Akkermansiaceae bacterium]|nr:glycosyltransferase [Akkermansiaceae bacterium]MDP4898757.1 glycosyltransferase [Akkermansiaceae bacterium]
MKILQIFNPYVNYGGEENAVNQISAELEKEHDLRNVFFDITKWARRTNPFARGCQFLMMACNPFAIRRVRKEIAEHKPDVILLHNIMPVGSAGLYLYLTWCGIPVVQYIHNFRPFSVNGYCWGAGRIMPDGLYGNFLPEIAAGSWQESRIKTAWYAILIWLMHKLGVYRGIAGWIAISGFMRDSFIKGGIDGEKIRVIPHSWTLSPSPENSTGDASTSGEHEPSFLFLGRLSEEKGLRVLLDAWEMHIDAGGGGKLLIAGGGSLADEVRKRCGDLRDAEFLGFKSGKAKTDLLKGCTALIVPSVWWEPLGLVLYEAYEHSKPVLAARSGGIVEHVDHGITGWIHEPGDARQLALHFKEASADPSRCREYGTNGHKLVEHRSTSLWISSFNEFMADVLSGKAEETPSSQPPLSVSVYLADQNPGFDRSFGISRMSSMILGSLSEKDGISLESVVSTTSQRPAADMSDTLTLPWGTRRKWARLATDHLHPLFTSAFHEPDVYYFPKGYLPLLDSYCSPSVVTIHDTIIQHDSDRYPAWRKPREYRYWESILKHTLRNTDRILTVSESSKGQITEFMRRHQIPPKDIVVTYEPCTYESLPQPEEPRKNNHVLHLASIEPHKRTAQMIRWWKELTDRGTDLPNLKLVGSIPPEAAATVKTSNNMELLPFLDDAELRNTYETSLAVIIPSEIEGFGLPALEGYYSGTPACFIKGTSIEEILSVTTSKGAFDLEDIDSLPKALNEVLSMSALEIKIHGLKLREAYSVEKVTARIEAELRKTSGLDNGLVAAQAILKNR